MSDIFICYARRDLKFSERIHQALAESELAVWVDWEDIPKAEDFLQTILRSIEEARVFVFLLSPNSIESDICRDELDHAVKNGKRIIPIVISDVEAKNVPLELSRLNWIFCREGKDSFDKAIKEIRNAIHTDYEWLKYHTELQAKALRWEQKKDNSRLLRGKDLLEAEQRLTDVKNIVDPQPTKIQKEYMLASRQHEHKLRRNISISLISGIGVLLSLILISAYLYRKLNSVSGGENNAASPDFFVVLLLIVGVVFGVIGVAFYAYNNLVRRGSVNIYKESSDAEIYIKVFLCHSSKDKPKVREYYERLKKEQGIDPWLDVEKLLPGVDWDLEIRSAVKSSDVVLVFLSKYSVNKEGYVQKEIRQALDVADEKPEGTIFIIPLRLEDCEVPERLKRWQWLNLYERDSYEKLLTSLRKRANDLAAKNIGVQ